MVDTIYFKILYIIASYLLGSVLFSYIVVKIYGRRGVKKTWQRSTVWELQELGVSMG